LHIYSLTARRGEEEATKKRKKKAIRQYLSSPHHNGFTGLGQPRESGKKKNVAYATVAHQTRITD
jgi:hypothetical protein